MADQRDGGPDSLTTHFRTSLKRMNCVIRSTVDLSFSAYQRGLYKSRRRRRLVACGEGILIFIGIFISGYGRLFSRNFRQFF